MRIAPRISMLSIGFLLPLVVTRALAGGTDVRIEIAVGGMSCDGCAESVREGLAGLDGVTKVDIRLRKRTVVVTFDKKKTSRAVLESRIGELGYVVGSDDPPVLYPEGADITTISKKGESVDVTKHLARGKVTVVDFFADWCKPCKALDRRLARLTGEHPKQLAVRKVNIVDWESPVTKRYLKKVPGLPYVRIYNAHGKLVVALHGDQVRQLSAYLRRLWGE